MKKTIHFIKKNNKCYLKNIDNVVKNNKNVWYQKFIVLLFFLIMKLLFEIKGKNDWNGMCKCNVKSNIFDINIYYPYTFIYTYIYLYTRFNFVIYLSNNTKLDLYCNILFNFIYFIFVYQFLNIIYLESIYCNEISISNLINLFVILYKNIGFHRKNRGVKYFLPESNSRIQRKNSGRLTGHNNYILLLDTFSNLW